MHTLLALVITVIACCVARPPVTTEQPPPMSTELPKEEKTQPFPSYDFFRDYFLPRVPYLNYWTYDETLRNRRLNERLFNRELQMLSQMSGPDFESYDEVPYWPVQEFPIYRAPTIYREPIMPMPRLNPFSKGMKMKQVSLQVVEPVKKNDGAALDTKKEKLKELTADNKNTIKKSFVLTPFDSRYFEPTDIVKTTLSTLVEPRQIRQNPNLIRHKSLVAENLDLLRTGFSHEEFKGTENPHHVHVLETASTNPAGFMYTVALVAAIGATVVLAVIGFGFGWYTYRK